MSGWFYFALFPAAVVVGILLLTFAPATGRDYFGRKTQSNTVWATALAIMGVAFLVAVSQGCGYKAALKNSIEERTFTVKKVERGTDDTPDLVYTNVGVFSVEDSLWLWKFDTSDRYGEIEKGKTYTCQVAGWRIRALSAWENLIDCEEVR